MKVGDLVQVLPAKIGYYIIIEQVGEEPYYGDRRWLLHPVGETESVHSGGGLMCEQFIEVISEGN